MQAARKSDLLRPSGRLLESRSDPGPRGMIIGRAIANLNASWASDCAATESGLQTRLLILLLLVVFLHPLSAICHRLASRLAHPAHAFWVPSVGEARSDPN